MPQQGGHPLYECPLDVINPLNLQTKVYDNLKKLISCKTILIPVHSNIE